MGYLKSGWHGQAKSARVFRMERQAGRDAIMISTAQSAFQSRIDGDLQSGGSFFATCAHRRRRAAFSTIRLPHSLTTHHSLPPMTDLEQIQSIRQLTLAQLVELRANPKPTYTIDGQIVSWTDYIVSLQNAIDWCDAKLVGLAPFEVRSQAIT